MIREKEPKYIIFINFFEILKSAGTFIPVPENEGISGEPIVNLAELSVGRQEELTALYSLVLFGD